MHGHEPVEEVERSANRWNLDTGAGIRRLNRLSLLEASAPELRSWTFDVVGGDGPTSAWFGCLNRPGFFAGGSLD